MSSVPVSPHSTDFILKVHNTDELRRALLKGTPNYEGILCALQKIWPHCSTKDAMYVDEKDGVEALEALTPGAFPHFLSTAKSTASAMVLELRLSNTPTTSGSDSTVSGSAVTAEDAFDAPWEHVEQANDVGDQGFYTVIDLTDMQMQDHSIDAAQGSTRDARTGGENSVQVTVSAAGAAEERSTMTELARQRDPQAAVDQAVEAETDWANAAELAEAEAHRNFEQRIDIVVAAFDTDGDGHLSCEDCRLLVSAAHGGELPGHAFDQMCVDIGTSPEKGLDREALMCIYCCGNPWMSLDRDFDAAKVKLQGAASEQHS